MSAESGDASVVEGAWGTLPPGRGGAPSEENVPQRYDAVVIGGGHNGLISGAYLARGGLQDARARAPRDPRRGDADPGGLPRLPLQRASRTWSACCGPEIIRDLQLPRHGLHILPLDGTFTPVDGDHLWRTDDHAHTMRELRRWSIDDAEAYEEYGQLMAQMARFIKPILAMTPTDPRRPDPRDAAGPGLAGQGLQRRCRAGSS